MRFTGSLIVMQRVLGILAGTDIAAESLLAWAESADVVIAADGAANRLLEAGLEPDLIVGDMDSLDPVLAETFEGLKVNMDQETTDCDKLLNFAKSKYPESPITIIGMEGDRFDHVLASLHSVGKLYPEARLVLRDGFAWFVRPGVRLQVGATEGQIVSLIPIVPCTGVEMGGVHWPPNPNLSPLGFTSISNMAKENSVSAEIETGLAVLILQSGILPPTWP